MVLDRPSRKSKPRSNLGMPTAGGRPGQHLALGKRAGFLARGRLEQPVRGAECGCGQDAQGQPGLRRGVDPRPSQAHRAFQPRRPEHRNLQAVDAGAARGADDAIKRAGIACRLGPEEGLARLDDMPRHRTVPHIGLGTDRLAPEPVALDPVDALDHVVLHGRGREQDEAVVAQRGGEGAQRVPDRGKGFGALDGKGAAECRLGRDRVGHRSATSFSRVWAASLPRLLPASGLSPVISWRSRCTAPEMSPFTISKPSAFSFSPNFQVRWPGI
ncbi:hypothetical protein PAAM106076_17765 [Paracoccus aminovorans]|nr:hypothetical protein JCM7685_0331 [Paracoccus aminovorans]